MTIPPVAIASQADLLDQVAATQRRRAFLKAALGASAAVLLGCRPTVSSTTGDSGAAPARRNPPARRPAPVATRPATCALTEENMEGPFFKPDAPRRSLLAPSSAPGRRLSIDGRVLSATCGPIAGALLEVWHADGQGTYDNDGFTFRGIVETDAAGRFAVQTIAPGRYLNGKQYRPAHIHVKVHAGGHRSLTTQLYFPNDPFNRVDAIIRPSLIAHVRDTYWGTRMAYDFVLARA